MMKSPFWKRAGGPSFHSSCRDRNPVNPSRAVRDVAANLLEAFTTEKLTSARDMIDPFKAIRGRIISVFNEWGSCYTEPRIRCELPHEKVKIIWFEGKIAIEISNDLKLEMPDPLKSVVESMNFAGKAA